MLQRRPEVQVVTVGGGQDDWWGLIGGGQSTVVGTLRDW